MRHERETLEAVISARNQAVGGLQKAAQDPGNAEAIRGLADAQRLARDWPTAHPRDSPPSPLSCYFCNGLQKRMLGHREESGVPKWNRTYVDAITPRKSAGYLVIFNPRPR